jgi:hypothetical protein
MWNSMFAFFERTVAAPARSAGNGCGDRIRDTRRGEVSHDDHGCTVAVDGGRHL